MPKRKGVYRLGRLDLFLMVKGSFEDDLTPDGISRGSAVNLPFLPEAKGNRLVS